METFEVAERVAWSRGRIEFLEGQLTEATRLLSVASGLIEGLADQQAMTDEWFVPEWNEIKRFIGEES